MASASNHVQNVAIVSGFDTLVFHLVDALLQSTSPKFKVTIISRPRPTNPYLSNLSTTIAIGEHTDHSFLVDTLKGQDALITSLAFSVHDEMQLLFIRAAAEANVSYLLSTDFGTDTTSLILKSQISGLQQKPEARNLIEKLGVSAWIGITCYPWYWSDWGMESSHFGIDLRNQRAVLFDGGSTKVNLSTLHLIGIATTKVLSLPKSAAASEPSLEGFKNKMICIRSFHINQLDILTEVQNVVGKDGWEISHKSTEEHIREGQERMAAGEANAVFRVFYGNLFKESIAESYPGPWANEVLGLPEEDFEEEIRQICEDILEC